MKNKKAQQEMVGFVLIVVLVVVGLMVFLVISLRSSPEEGSNLRGENLLDAIFEHTTECAIIFEPQYDSFEALFKSCYKGNRCENIGMTACEYLGDSLSEVLEEIAKSETTLQSYELSFFEKGGEIVLPLISSGECGSRARISAAQRNLVSGSNSLIVRLKICED